MKFTPLSKKYEFDNSVLSMDFPDYLRKPLSNWVFNLLKRSQKIEGDFISYTHSEWFLKTSFYEHLSIELRETYPNKYSDFIHFVFAEDERLMTILQWCLNYYAILKDADSLEWILYNGGSGYAVIKTKKDAGVYNTGVYDLVERVPQLVKQWSKIALSYEEELNEAWVACYGRNPDYSKTVQKSQNVLEKILRDTYLPDDKKAQFGKLIIDIKNGKKLKFVGSKILDDSNVMLSLIKHVPEYREMHTAGNGKKPDKEVATFVLHTTIYFWNLHNRSKNE